MNSTSKECCILNGGNSAWAFESLAAELSKVLAIDVSSTPRRFNYLLASDSWETIEPQTLFIPPAALKSAADKRLLAQIFFKHAVSTPETHLLAAFEEVLHLARERQDKEWCIKFPTSCGASGHFLLTAQVAEPSNWPKPFVVQEFVRLPEPVVYRTYCSSGQIFGWMARRFLNGKTASPWVAHARGARYVPGGVRPDAVTEVARHALVAVDLLDSFGCVDLIPASDGRWLALEVGTDGIHNHVDRDVGDETLTELINTHLRSAFWQWVNEVKR